MMLNITLQNHLNKFCISQSNCFMLIKTRKFKLPVKIYVKFGFLNMFKSLWWVWAIPLVLVGIGAIFPSAFWWLFSISLTLSLLYVVFLALQFYAISQHQQSKVIFRNLSYEIDAEKILVRLNAKQGMPIFWRDLEKGRIGKNYILLFVNRGHLIYLPFSLFKNQNQIRFIETQIKKYKLK